MAKGHPCAEPGEPATPLSASKTVSPAPASMNSEEIGAVEVRLQGEVNVSPHSETDHAVPAADPQLPAPSAPVPRLAPPLMVGIRRLPPIWRPAVERPVRPVVEKGVVSS